MKHAAGRLLAALFLVLSLCRPALARPIPQGITPCRLYYTDSQALIESGATAAEFRAAGFDAILTGGAQWLHYRWLEWPLSTADVRASLAATIQAADGLPVWLELGSSTQASYPRPGDPCRSFYAPRDALHRDLALANLRLIGREAWAAGIRHVGFDWEPYGVAAMAYTYPAPQARELGRDLARALRTDAPDLELFGFGPLGLYTWAPGFRPLLRGYYGEAGRSGILFPEDGYGMPADEARILRWAGRYSGARVTAGAWFATDRAAAGPAWYDACLPGLRSAWTRAPVLMVYREGAPLFRDRPDYAAALRRVLQALVAEEPTRPP